MENSLRVRSVVLRIDLPEVHTPVQSREILVDSAAGPENCFCYT